MNFDMKGKADQAAQHQRFIETARALGCDEDKERFEAALGKIAASHPKAASSSGKVGEPKGKVSKSHPKSV
jgi:hypothetical protein